MKKLILLCLISSFGIMASAQVEIGTATNFTEIEGDGTIEFHGEATVWNDYVVPFSSVKTKDTKAPTWQLFKDGISQYGFSDQGTESNEEEVGFTIQLPHDWDGSAIYPHVHWSPAGNGTGSVVWGIEYTWVNYNSSSNLAFPTSEIDTVHSEYLSNNGLQHLIASFDPITPSAAQNKISSILVVRFYRHSSITADDYLDDAFALSFDIHYRTNTMGSRDPFTK